MRLFHQFIVRALLREPLRSGVTVLGIALGVAVVIAIRMANASSIAGFETALDVMSGRTSLEIVGPGTGLDEARVRELGWLRQWGDVSPVIEGDVVAVTPGEAPDEMLRVLGVDILRDQPIRDYRLLGFAQQATSQAFLALLLDPRAIVLTEKFAKPARLPGGQPGDARDRGPGAGVRGPRPAERRGPRARARRELRPDGHRGGAVGARPTRARSTASTFACADPDAIDSVEQAIAARLPDGTRGAATRAARAGRWRRCSPPST